mmetsp:Transcript_10666/g.24266  ORF Transcript_10666/g.24266 Transcript_10666/m.24266 type:complete len:484 (+) Transcript_10666:62-1513(+)
MGAASCCGNGSDAAKSAETASAVALQQEVKWETDDTTSVPLSTTQIPPQRESPREDGLGTVLFSMLEEPPTTSSSASMSPAELRGKSREEDQEALRLRLLHKDAQVRQKIMDGVIARPNTPGTSHSLQSPTRRRVSREVDVTEVCLQKFLLMVVGGSAAQAVTAACGSSEAVRAEEPSQVLQGGSGLQGFEMPNRPSDFFMSDQGTIEGEMQREDSELHSTEEVLNFESVSSRNTTAAAHQQGDAHLSRGGSAGSSAVLSPGMVPGSCDANCDTCRCTVPVPYPWGRVRTQDTQIYVARLRFYVKPTLEELPSTSLFSDTSTGALVLCLVVDPKRGQPSFEDQTKQMVTSLKGTSKDKNAGKTVLLLRNSKVPQVQGVLPPEEEEPWMKTWKNFEGVVGKEISARFGPVALSDGNGLYAAFAKVVTHSLFQAGGMSKAKEGSAFQTTVRGSSMQSRLDSRLSSLQSTLPCYDTEHGGSSRASA